MTEDGLLYQNGDWGIYTAESVGLAGYISDVVHACDTKYKVDEYDLISYQIIGVTECPGCGEIQPDDIQTLWQLHNWDVPRVTRLWGKGPLEAALDTQREMIRLAFRRYPRV